MSTVAIVGMCIYSALIGMALTLVVLAQVEVRAAKRRARQH